MEQVFLSGDPDVSYNVSCETSMAACESHPGLLCNVLPSVATASSPQALSFEDAFDGDVRRRLTHFLGIEHKDSQQCKNVGCDSHSLGARTAREPQTFRSSTFELGRPRYHTARVSVSSGWFRLEMVRASSEFYNAEHGTGGH